MERVWVIGGGLAGCEVALQLARRRIPVRLFEMKQRRRTPAQTSDGFAELVCSNSFRAAGLESAVGVIKEEMRRVGGALIAFADQARVPAGGALAVDREVFSKLVTEAVRSDPYIEIVHAEMTELPSGPEAARVVVATGPLTSDDLARDIREACGGQEHLYFYDAIAPIVAADSVDRTVVFAGSRYGKGGGDDYLNCPMNREEYESFVQAVHAAEKVTPRAFEEQRYFEGCLPIEVLVERGPDTLRFGCMKPVGLTDPRTGRRPYAAVQLRTENLDQTAFNLVGFQTRMKWGAQDQTLRMIPGLERAEILRYGSVHRNTYLDAPSLFDEGFRLKTRPSIRFAGQITGVEGYVESTACGLLVGLMLASEMMGKAMRIPPATTALGALHGHVLGTRRAPGTEKHGHVPSNIHWGLFPALSQKAGKKDRKRLYGERALEDLDAWWADQRF